MNKHDVKEREEVGYKDMKNYEHGGLEIEETLTNGYLLYVPYGIHCDIFDAIEQGIVTLKYDVNEMEKDFKDLDSPVLKKQIEQRIKDLKKHIDVLEQISPIKHEV